MSVISSLVLSLGLGFEFVVFGLWSLVSEFHEYVFHALLIGKNEHQIEKL